MVPLVEQNEPDVLKYQFFATQDGIVVSQEMCKFLPKVTIRKY